MKFLHTVLSLLTLTCCSTLCGATATQVIPLEPGWNSVWLEVAPLDGEGSAQSVETVFNNANISYVATPRLPVGTAEFITEQSGGSFNQGSWKTWHRASEFGENSLATINGYQAYLVKVDGSNSLSLDVTGEAEFFQSLWTANNYNLLGFSLTGDDTFGNFFAGFTGSHPINKIFRLAADGNWTAVSFSDTIKSGEAYWIYAEGHSNFTGPVKIDFNNFDGLNFGPGPAEVEVADPDGGVGTIFVNLSEITLSNISSSEQNVSIEKISPATTTLSATDDLRIYDITPQPNLLDYAIGSQITDNSVATLPASTSESVTIGAHRNWSTGSRERENLYRIVIGKLAYWLPIRAQNGDLIDAVADENAADVASYQGLWIGDAIVNEVTSASESGRPLRSTTSSAPIRFIFHVDASGAVSLLDHVTLMQTKRASEEIQPTLVLVVDDTKIPFFEGIEERSGTLAGKRYESVAYDMPRKVDLATQVDLLDEVVNLSEDDSIDDVSDVTLADLSNYINSRSSRPPQLAEDYHLIWGATGGFGPGNAVTTELLLDPFHRANPFRHAFHSKHVAGFPITRSITIGFDPTQSAGRLTGTYTEVLSGAGGVAGLASFDIVTRGSISLQRISEVGTLE